MKVNRPVSKMIREPLSREDVVKAIERKGGSRIPLVFHKWWGNGLVDKYGAKLIDTLYKPEGGLLLAMGNGIMPDTSYENIDTALYEMAVYK
jgi:hypothetical protein